MAGKRRRANGWEYVFKRAGVLEKPLYLTFDTEAEGDAFAARLELLLDRGIVPTEYQPKSSITTIETLARAYMQEAHPSHKDQGALEVTLKTRGSTALLRINAGWVDDWIAEMKRVERLAPATIRARVGALARCTDWGMRRGYLVMPDHALRTLPDGYAQYTKTDAANAGQTRVDVERDRRIEPGEDKRILEVIDAGVLARAQRPYRLPDPKALRCMFTLGLESAMRMREMYTLTVGQVDLAKRTVFLDKTKNGDKRQVPLSTVALAALRERLKFLGKRDPQSLIFPWWDGDTSQKALVKASDYISKLYAGIFGQAGCADLRFHDLRHEATSRLFEKTKLSETQIMKITGHKSHRMMMRYANLRGSDLAEQLW